LAQSEVKNLILIVNDTAYPFEFTAPVPSEARQIVIELSGITTDGQLVRSGTFKLSKD
jgi:hypothetical protein